MPRRRNADRPRRRPVRTYVASHRHKPVGVIGFLATMLLYGVALLVGFIVLLHVVDRQNTRSVIRDTQLCEQANIDTALRPLFVPVPSITEKIDEFVDDVRLHDTDCKLVKFPTLPLQPTPTATVTVTKHGKTITRTVTRPPIIITVAPRPHPTQPPASKPTRRPKHHKPTPAPTKTCLYTLPVTGQPVCLPKMSPLAVHPGGHDGT